MNPCIASYLPDNYSLSVSPPPSIFNCESKTEYWHCIAAEYIDQWNLTRSADRRPTVSDSSKTMSSGAPNNITIYLKSSILFFHLVE